jgi:hypothetical protein
MKRMIVLTLCVVALAALPSCVKVQLDQQKPIHVVVDVNIRIDRQLDDFFAFERKLLEPSTKPAGAESQPELPRSES